MQSGSAQESDTTASELRRRIIIFLSQKGVSSAGRLSIAVNEGTVTLRGTVASFYERQMCLCCKHVPGVRKVIDDLKVELPTASENGTLRCSGSDGHSKCLIRPLELSKEGSVLCRNGRRPSTGRRAVYREDLKAEAVQMLLDGHSATSVASRLGL